MSNDGVNIGQLEDTVASAILRQGPTAILVVDDRGVIATCNENALELFGYRRQQLVGLRVEMLVPIDQRDRHIELRAGYARTPRRRPMQDDGGLCGLHRSGRCMPVEIDLLPVEFAGRDWVIASIVDVSARQRTRNALRLSDERLRTAQRVAKFGFWDWNIDTGTLYWSAEIFGIFGLEPRTLAPTYSGFLQAVHPDDRTLVQEAVDAAIHGRQKYAIDHRVVRPGGDIRYVHEQGEIMRNAAGGPERMIGTVLDITERRALEAQLAQSQKMEAIGLLAGGIAHDFNNLLTIIVSHADLALRNLVGPESTRTGLQKVLDASASASRLIRQLLTFSRKGVIQPRPLDLNDVVCAMRTIIDRVVPEYVEASVLLQPGLWATRADLSQIEQVVLNLVVNARDAMKTQGELKVVTRNVTLGAGDAPGGVTLRAGDYVCLSVADTGEGMAPDVANRAFEPFYTTKGAGRGTGLGLATCHGIATRIGGSIALHTQAGRGSTFDVYLPRCHEPVQPLASAQAPEAPLAPAAIEGNETILLVEDEEDLRGLIAEQLRDAGYQVFEAKDGEAAARLAQSPRWRMDLLISDVMMPQLGGIDLASRLGTGGRRFRTLFISGYANDVLSDQGVLAPDAHLLPKPFTVGQLLERVRELLDSADAPAV